MDELETRCLDAFPEWLLTLASDARALAAHVEERTLPEAVLRAAVVSLNYLFKSIDLIPDGVEDLGFMDDAFVLRVALARALEGGEAEEPAVLVKLAGEAALIEDFLGEDYARLAAHIGAFDGTSVRGRSVDDVLGSEEARLAFVAEVRAWADSYAAPSFTRDEKSLVKLRSFMHTKLPG